MRKCFTLVAVMMMSTWVFGQYCDCSISTDSNHEGGGGGDTIVDVTPPEIVLSSAFSWGGGKLELPGGSSTMQDMGDTSPSGGLFNAAGYSQMSTLGNQGMNSFLAGVSLVGRISTAGMGGAAFGAVGALGTGLAAAGAIMPDPMANCPNCEMVGVKPLGEEGGIPMPENMRNFSDKDLLLGEFSQLPKFKLWGGNKGRMGKVGSADPDFIIPQIRSTRAFGGTVRFNLEGFSIRRAMDPNSMWYWEESQNYTSKEYRSIITHWEEVKDVMLFYTGPYPY